MKTISTLLLLITILAISGCESETGSGTTPATLIPLKEGNYWVYENSVYDSVGTLLGRAYDTITIGKAVTIDGQVWYEKLRSGFTVPADSAAYSNQPDGVWERYVLPVGAFTQFLYKYPTVANDTFALRIGKPFPVHIEKSFSMTVATIEQIVVPSGTFPTIHYRRFLQALDSVTMEVINSIVVADQYVAPGIGLVRSTSETFVGFPGMIRNHESILVRYSLK